MKSVIPFISLALLFCSQPVTWAQDAATDTQTPMTVEERIDDLQNLIDVLKDGINEPEGSIQTTVNDVKKIQKVKVSGYIQVRFQDTYNKATNGDITQTDNFDVRRARFKITGTPTDNTTAVLQIDAAKASLTAKDAYIMYAFGDGNIARNYVVTAGQFLTPFGFQLVQSSSVRETPELANVVKNIFDPVEYDRGVKITTPTKNRLFAELGIMTGAGANNADDNRSKNFAARVRYQITDQLDAGISGYYGKNRLAVIPATAPATTQDLEKKYVGVDAQYFLDKTTIKAEYITGEEPFTRASGDNTTPNQLAQKFGYYVQVARNITTKDTAVVMYDVFQDKSPTVQTAKGKVTAWNLGWIHALDSKTRVKLFYQINNEEANTRTNNVATVELLSVF